MRISADELIQALYENMAAHDLVMINSHDPVRQRTERRVVEATQALIECLERSRWDTEMLSKKRKL